MARLQFRRVRAGYYAADVGARVYFLGRVKGGGWLLTAWCAGYTDDVRPHPSRTKARGMIMARELERARVARAGRR